MKQGKGTSVLSWFKGVNHWSFGIALFGFLLSVSPSAMEPGIGLSAVGVAYFAAHRALRLEFTAHCKGIITRGSYSSGSK